MLRVGISIDQVDVSNLLSAERNPSSPAYSGLDLVMEQPVGAAGQAVTMDFNNWVAGKLKERANIQKQARLCREEFGGRRRAVKGDAGEKGDKDRGRRLLWSRLLSSMSERTPRMDLGQSGVRGHSCNFETDFEDSRDLRHHGAPFPLGPGVRQGLAPREEKTINALNRLAGYKFEKPLPQHSHRPPTAVQLKLTQRVHDLIEGAGPAPEGMTSESALRDLMGSTSQPLRRGAWPYCKL